MISITGSRAGKKRFRCTMSDRLWTVDPADFDVTQEEPYQMALRGELANTYDQHYGQSGREETISLHDVRSDLDSRYGRFRCDAGRALSNGAARRTCQYLLSALRAVGPGRNDFAARC